MMINNRLTSGTITTFGKEEKILDYIERLDKEAELGNKYSEILSNAWKGLLIEYSPLLDEVNKKEFKELIKEK